MVDIKLSDEPMRMEGEFTQKNWDDLVTRIADLYHFDTDRREGMRQNRTIKLVAALPFIAGCRNPMRVALSHMSVYILASSKEGKDVFLHGFSDNGSLMTRLERISHFDGGDSVVIDRGMKMIAYSMIGDHYHDAESDAAEGKYNPLNSGIWDYKAIVKQLADDIRSVDCPKLDEIMNIEYGPLAYWAV